MFYAKWMLSVTKEYVDPFLTQPCIPVEKCLNMRLNHVGRVLWTVSLGKPPEDGTLMRFTWHWTWVCVHWMFKFSHFPFSLIECQWRVHHGIRLTFFFSPHRSSTMRRGGWRKRAENDGWEKWVCLNEYLNVQTIFVVFSLSRALRYNAWLYYWSFCFHNALKTLTLSINPNPWTVILPSRVIYFNLSQHW